MSVQPVTEPLVRPQREHEVAEPGVRPGRTDSPLTHHDHVTSHSIKCYWDFVECRWQCKD